MIFPYRQGPHVFWTWGLCFNYGYADNFESYENSNEEKKSIYYSSIATALGIV